MDEWTYNLDRGVQIDVIYTDFEKALDKVPHQGLISKLKAYNFNSELLRWIQDFLCNRKQRVVVSGNYSDGTEYKLVEFLRAVFWDHSYF